MTIERDEQVVRSNRYGTVVLVTRMCLDPRTFEPVRGYEVRTAGNRCVFAYQKSLSAAEYEFKRWAGSSDESVG